MPLRFEQTTEILRLMKQKQNIRNIGIIAHIDHGKTTLTDNLLAQAGLLSPSIAGQARALDYLEEEQRRGITIKTANISLLHDVNSKPHLINLVDTPGHVDFTGKVTQALRAIDGAIVVVDAVEEIMAQTETVTKQALQERVKPILFINKIDRLIKELKLTPKQTQIKLNHVISDFNNLIEIHAEPEFKDQWKAAPAKDNVAFGSALHKWGFTQEVARRKDIKFSDIAKAYQHQTYQQLHTIVPLADAILNMTAKHLPNPIQAQKYRIPKIWKGNQASEIGQALIECNDAGPTVICITRVTTDPHADSIITGRLFSGRIRQGDTVHLIGADKDQQIQEVSLYMGIVRETVDQITAGNIAALSGLGQVRVGETLVDAAHKHIMVPFEKIRYVSEPVVTIALETKNPSDLTRLVDAMQRLIIEDPNLATSINRDTGEYLLSGMGELHLEVAVKFLKDYAEKDIEIIASKPLIVLRETISDSGIVARATSPNRLNQIWIQVEPLEKPILDMLDNEEITIDMNSEQVATVLQKQGFRHEDMDVWAIEEHRNLLVNAAKSIQPLNDVKDTIVAGFKWACQNGPLCGEPMRGTKARLIDAQLSEDAAKRAPSEILPTTGRAIFGSFLTANTMLLEPIYRIIVSVPPQHVGAIGNIMTRRRAKITSTESRGLTTNISALIPVASTFNLSAEIRSAAGGQAFWQSAFDHWENAPEEKASTLIQEIRKRKGLPSTIPKANKFTSRNS